MDIAVKYMNEIYHVVKIFEDGKCVAIRNDGFINIFDIRNSVAIIENDINI